jgi:tRNA(fMet)-specific endonuclease VapC
MMRMWLLDTNVISHWSCNRDPLFSQRLDAHAEYLCTSAIVAAEIRFGLAKRGARRELAIVNEGILSRLKIFDWPVEASHTYAELRVALESDGQPIGGLDMLIAAHALTLNATLVTRHTRAYARIAGLRVENWFSENV